MERVSFEVAKAVKEAGYQQEGCWWFAKDGKECYSESDVDEIGYIAAPTYIEVWLWLWRNKHKFVECVYKEGRFFNYKTSYSYADPEEAIINGIDYLVNNKILK